MGKKIKKKEVIFKKDKEKVCLTCVRMNRVHNIKDNVCLTCLQGNRKQNIADIS